MKIRPSNIHFIAAIYEGIVILAEINILKHEAPIILYKTQF